ncbi:MAG: Rdx family protein [Pirellulales bacterium]|nr:Rdx family protein [Pirellulales bacterium]
MAAKIEAAHQDRVGKVKLIASGGGCFELSLDGKLLYSKLQTGEFPDEDALVKLIGEQLS